jgi:hypothetical protein
MTGPPNALQRGKHSDGVQRAVGDFADMHHPVLDSFGSGSMQRAAAGLAPLRLGPAGDVQRRPSPAGGGHAGHLEMAETLISTGLLEIISN